MSMNIHINAKRTLYTKSGRAIEDYKRFDTWQTRTEVTYAILAHEGVEAQLDAYKEWVRSRSTDEVLPVYAEDDFLHEREPVGERTFNYGESHIRDLDEWLKMVKKEEFEEIVVFMM